MLFQFNMDPERYKQFETDLQKEFNQIIRAVPPLKPGPNYLGYDITSGSRNITILLASKARQPVGLIHLIEGENLTPDDCYSVLTTRSFILPELRGQGLLKQLLIEADKVVNKMFQDSLQFDNPHGKPFFIIEDLFIPETSEFSKLLTSVSKTLLETGYLNLPDKPTVFVKPIGNLPLVK